MTTPRLVELLPSWIREECRMQCKPWTRGVCNAKVALHVTTPVVEAVR